MASNIDPRIWGSSGWIFLRNIAKGYPDKPTQQDKEKYKKYFELIGEVLPCSKCRYNYKKHWKEVNINEYLHHKNALYRWVNIIKNKTNTRHMDIKNRLINERIVRIKESRKARANSQSGCRGCGNR